MSAPLALRVVTFNIHGGRPKAGPAELEATAGVIAALRPDLVGLQEVHRYVPPPGQLRDQPGRLRSLLGMATTFRPSLGFGPCGYGNVVLSPAPPELVRRIYLPGAGERRALIDAWVTVRGRVLRFLNTHLALRPEDRGEQAAAVAAEIRKYDLPVIAVGDWNTGPDAPEVRAIEAAGLTHCAPPGLLTFPGDTPTVRLDYIMVSPHFRTERCWTVETAASDHLPLIADLVLLPDGSNHGDTETRRRGVLDTDGHR